MGARIPKIVSPFSGEEKAGPAIGYFPPQDEHNLTRWRAWWKVAHREQFITFFLIGLAAILLFMMLAYTMVGVGGDAEGFAFIRAAGEAMQDQMAPWVGTAFWFTGMVVLLSTNFTVLDMVGRMVADICKTNWLRESTRWTESRLYFTVVWAMIIFGSVILLAGVDQPLVLLVIASALNGLVMFVYSALLIALNRGMLPRAMGLKGVRFGALIWAVLFYGGFSLYLLYDQALRLF